MVYILLSTFCVFDVKHDMLKFTSNTCLETMWKAILYTKDDSIFPFASDGEVKLKSYDASAAGVIQSFVDRFPSTDVEDVVQELWEKDRHHFQR